MELILDALVQFGEITLVLVLAPLLTGYVRKVKARLLRRQGPPLLQPYRDLARLIRKEVVLADNASWVFRAAPYLIFATTWVAASLVPTFATGLAFSPAADLIAIVALLGSARFMLALAGLDVGTSFGGIGSSREMMIASLAEPAMLMVVSPCRSSPAPPSSRRSRPSCRVPTSGCGSRSRSPCRESSWSRSPRTRGSRSTTRRPISS
jgi:formate hydrogenlyase subunit 4